MTFSPGSLVSVRGREWVVLPESEPELLLLRPLGGSEEEVTGIYLPEDGPPLEQVTPARFAPPDPKGDLGSHLSCGLLRDAVRLSIRAGAGPFRCLARIAVDPRPYQFVPLLMALRQDPVRLLIADDVGVGKTVEALLIARELLDRGEIRRIAVITPPALAEQWQRAMVEQFHIDAALVLRSTANRLERALRPGESLFERHPHVVVSMDWIKSKRRRDEFRRTCPGFVIVDEAHTCAEGSPGRASQQRHRLLAALSEKDDRHLVLVTATPHSGKLAPFRSLLTLLDEKLATLPDDLAGEKNRRHRERLARHLVQRRRGDLSHYLAAKTPFPERRTEDYSYRMAPALRDLLDQVLAWCREQVFDQTLDKRRRRVRWWSALALLRSLSSSPAAAAATLRNRAAMGETEEEIDAFGRRLVLDPADADDDPALEPGCRTGDEPAAARRRLRRFAAAADRLAGKQDRKIEAACRIARKLLRDGWSPIFFCRFIPTADYLAANLRSALPKKVNIQSITGILPPEEREARVAELGESDQRILVCTNCLSEGVNLQQSFDAVVHYDLAWSPTRHEQREGRVDRFGQPRPLVKTVTLIGKDNPVDGIVLNVLIEKHRAIRKQLGISVPVPVETDAVIDAIFEGLMLRRAEPEQMAFDFAEPERLKLADAFDAAARREKKSRSLFAQAGIKVDEVAREIEEARKALGGEAAVERFIRGSLRAMDVPVGDKTPAAIDLSRVEAPLRDAVSQDGPITVTFHPPAKPPALLLNRTHPFVAGLASYLLEAAVDPHLEGAAGGPASRCGVTLTNAVCARTVLLLLRIRFHIKSSDQSGNPRTLLSEEVATIAFRKSPKAPLWLDEKETARLFEAKPAGNIPDDVKRHHLTKLLGGLDALAKELEDVARQRGDRLLAAHRRVRKAAHLRLRALSVKPQLPPDLIGLYLFLPKGMP